jgi:uncharacterized protein (DUF302 family)
MRILLPLLILAAAAAAAGPIQPREGWATHDSDKGYDALLADLKAAVEAEDMAVVTEAGPTEAAASRGVEIPGNRVVGVFRNDFAVRALEASAPAMIEAPIRFYVVEDPEGGSQLAWKRPSHVFAPYADTGGEALAEVAAELDAIFEAIGQRALE